MNTKLLDLLQEAVTNGIISVDSVQEQINMKKRKEIIEQHPYSVWEGKNDGKWYTYVYDETKPKNRRLVKRTTKKKIYDFIIGDYQNNHSKDKNKNDITLRDLYPEWLEYKYLQVNSSGTIQRINNDWKRFYINDEYNKENHTNIVDIPTKKLNKITLNRWVHHMIKYGNDIPYLTPRKKTDNRPNMSKKQYYNMTVIIRGMLDYAVDKELLDNNPMSNIKIDNRLFRKIAKKKDETQVYLKNEVPKIMNMAWGEFHKTNDVTCLSIVLNFYLGLRVGELVVLNRNDINWNSMYIHIGHQCVREYDMSDITNGKFIGYKDVLYTKSDAGDRYVYLTNESRRILKIIINTIDKYQKNSKDYKKGYLFIKDGMRMNDNRVEGLLSKYCRKLNIINKSNHKIRKTFISTLFDNGININTIREMVGHEDEQTTLHSYTFNRLGNQETEILLEKSLSI